MDRREWHGHGMAWDGMGMAWEWGELCKVPRQVHMVHMVLEGLAREKERRIYVCTYIISLYRYPFPFIFILYRY